jgi:hypothetical protein
MGTEAWTKNNLIELKRVSKRCQMAIPSTLRVME